MQPTLASTDYIPSLSSRRQRLAFITASSVGLRCDASRFYFAWRHLMRRQLDRIWRKLGQPVGLLFAGAAANRSIDV
jgi:hypothetical protein